MSEFSTAAKAERNSLLEARAKIDAQIQALDHFLASYNGVADVAGATKVRKPRVSKPSTAKAGKSGRRTRMAKDEQINRVMSVLANAGDTGMSINDITDAVSGMKRPAVNSTVVLLAKRDPAWVETVGENKRNARYILSAHGTANMSEVPVSDEAPVDEDEAPEDEGPEDESVPVDEYEAEASEATTEADEDFGPDITPGNF